MNIRKNVSLKPFNTFGIDVTSQCFAEATSLDELKRIILDPQWKEIPILILGGGSNILLTKDFPGLVIKNSLKGIEQIREDENHVWIKSYAGEVWHELVLYCIQNNLAGIENLSLIPGLVGAAPMQNIGAYGVELQSVFESLEAINRGTGETKAFSNKECEFGYRESVFKKSLKDCYIIVSVTLRLNKQPDFNISYGAIQHTLDEMGINELSIKAISDAVIKIRSSKLPDPKEIGNSGSFFKNPEISLTDYQALHKKYPEMPGYTLPNDQVKIPAGWLIEQCGWKGKRVGETGAHKNQALVLVNYGNAKGEEIKELAFKIKDSVEEKFGIALTPEVNII